MQIQPVVDQRNLVEIVGEFERSKGYEPSAGYGGIVPDFFRFGRLDRYYLGEQEPWTNGKAVALLACDRGELGCWPLLHAVVEVATDIVIWRNFAQLHRPVWDYTELGTFTFDKQHYERAVK